MTTTSLRHLRWPCLSLAFVSAVVLGARALAAAPSSVTLAAGPIWTRHAIDATSRGADGVKLADVNHDGWLDIVTGWEEGGEVRMYVNPGPERTRAAWPRVTVGSVRDPEDAAFCDLDGDGRLEVVSCTEGKARTVFRHRFTGQAGDMLSPSVWQTEPFPVTIGVQAWMQAAALDLDGRYGTDLLLASKNADGAVGWLQSPRSPGDLAAWQYHRLRDAGWVMSLTPRDLDGDGDPDVVFSDRKGPRSGVFWLENPGVEANREHAVWDEHAIGGLRRQVMFADLGDLNDDGLLDVAVAVKPADVVLCLQQPGGVWQEETITLEAADLGDAKAVKIVDVNGDDRADLVFSCENASGPREGVVWLEQSRAARPAAERSRALDAAWLQHHLGGPDGVKFDLIQTLDLDADGDQDVLTCEERDQLGVIWYENPHR